MSKIHHLRKVCTRTVLALVAAAAMTTLSSTGNVAADDSASAPDAGVVTSFSGYMVAVG